VTIFTSPVLQWPLAHASRFRLDGDIHYQFPSNTFVPPRSFVVVAADPVAVQAVYGATGVMGPYANSLPHGAGVVRLRDDLDGILLETQYRSTPPWPAAADGAGCSLVLARPDFGENDARA